MCIDIMTIALVIIALYIVGMLFVALNDGRPTCLFHRWRIVETRKLDGSLEYRVERNGSLGMPFLYSADSGRIGNSVLTEYSSRRLTLEEAKKLLSERVSAYKSITVSGETYMYVRDIVPESIEKN